MPSSTPKQARTMAAIAHGAHLDKIHIPIAVAKDFNRADVRTGILKKRRPVKK